MKSKDDTIRQQIVLDLTTDWKTILSPNIIVRTDTDGHYVILCELKRVHVLIEGPAPDIAEALMGS